MTTDRHREKPLSLRLGDQRQRLEAHARSISRPVRRVIKDAVVEYLDRREMSGKQVHHLDGDPRNVDPSNLELREQ